MVRAWIDGAGRCRRVDDHGPRAGRILCRRPAVDATWALFSEGGTRRAIAMAKSVVAGTAVFALCFLPQALAYLVLNGRLGPATIVSAKMRWSAPHAWQVLFSPEHGLFFWTPLALICIAGLMAYGIWRPGGTPVAPDHRRLMICLLLMFGSQVYISGSIDTWTLAARSANGGFSAHRSCWSAAGCLAPRSEGVEANGVGGALAISVWWNLALMAQFRRRSHGSAAPGTRP